MSAPVSSGCGGGCGGAVSYSDGGYSSGTTMSSPAQPVMEGAQVQSLQAAPVPAVAPSQPSALDGGSIRNPVVDPSAFIFRGKSNFRSN